MADQALYQHVLKRGERTYHIRFKNCIVRHTNDEVKDILNTVIEHTLLKDVVDNQGETLLHLAAKSNNVDLIRYLLEMGCDINAINSSEETPLFTAIRESSLEAMKLLMDLNANVCESRAEHALLIIITRMSTLSTSTLTAFMNTLIRCCTNLAGLLARVECPLSLVVYIGDVNLTQIMLQIIPNITDKKDDEIAFTHVLETGDIENFRLLWQSKRMVNYREKWLQEIHTSIVNATDMWDMYMPFFQRLSDWIEFDTRFLNFMVAIFSSAREREIQVFLERYNIDVLVRQKYEQLDLLPNLFKNKKLNRTYLMQVVRERQFNVNAKSTMGHTALHHAVMYNMPDNVKLLCDLGADCNVVDYSGFAPLCFAIGYKCGEILVMNGADFCFTRYKGCTVIDKLSDHFHEKPWARKLITVMLAQLVIEKHKGVHIEKKILDKLNRVPKYRNFIGKFTKEVQKMSRLEVVTSLTAFSIITSKPKSIALKIQSRSIITSISEKYSKLSLHSYYCHLMKRNLEIAFSYYRTQCLFAKIFFNTVSIPIDIDHLVINRMVDFLSYKNMFNFISAFR